MTMPADSVLQVHPPESCNTATNSFQTFSSAVTWLFTFAAQARNGGGMDEKGSAGSQTVLSYHPPTWYFEENPNRFQK